MSFWSNLFGGKSTPETEEQKNARLLDDFAAKAAAESESLMEFASKRGFTVKRTLKKDEQGQTVQFWHDIKLDRAGKTPLERAVQIVASASGIEYTILPGNESRNINSISDVNAYLERKKKEALGKAA